MNYSLNYGEVLNCNKYGRILFATCVYYSKLWCI